MIDHTKEPWSIDADQTTILNDNQSVICDTALSSMYHGEDVENARRIVACVNACTGVSTEALESQGGKYINAMAQRDELLAALIELRDVAERCDGWSQFPEKAISEANNVIAKCEAK